jgi:hypothetical protein
MSGYNTTDEPNLKAIKDAVKVGEIIRLIDTGPTDSTKPPGEGYEWRGAKDSNPGDREGSWFKESTKEYWRNDPLPNKHNEAHWDHRDIEGRVWRVYPDGRWERVK